MSLRILAIFAITEFVLCLTPGPAVFLVVSQSMRSGFESSLRGAAGILTGNAIYFVLSAVGLGALLMASATLIALPNRIAGVILIAAGLSLSAIRRV